VDALPEAVDATGSWPSRRRIRRPMPASRLRRATLFALLTAGLPALAQDRPLYRDATRPVDERVRDLLGRMTLEEKVAQTLALWKGKEKITDAAGHFDAQGAA